MSQVFRAWERTNFDKRFFKAQIFRCWSTQQAKKQNVDEERAAEKMNATINDGRHKMELVLQKTNEAEEKKVLTSVTRTCQKKAYGV